MWENYTTRFLVLKYPVLYICCSYPKDMIHLDSEVLPKSLRLYSYINIQCSDVTFFFYCCTTFSLRKYFCRTFSPMTYSFYTDGVRLGPGSAHSGTPPELWWCCRLRVNRCAPLWRSAATRRRYRKSEGTGSTETRRSDSSPPASQSASGCSCPGWPAE